MRFKKNITITLACIITECFISFIPSIFLLYAFFFSDKFGEILSALLVVPYLIIIFNVILLIPTLVSQIFIKTKYYLKNETLKVFSPKKQFEIDYNDIAYMNYDFGNYLTKFDNNSSKLELFDKDSKELLSINNPSIVMIHLLKRKCPNAEMSYYHNKRFLFLLALVNGTALVLFILIKLFA